MIRCKGTYHQYANQLKALKKDFVLKTTTGSQYIELPVSLSALELDSKAKGRRMIFSEQHFKKRDLHLFNAIKKEVTKNIEGKTIPHHEGALYNHFRKHFYALGSGEMMEFEDCIEFDINKAYYNVAYKLGYIGKEFYEKCLGLEKFTRLALIGSIATQKYVYHFEKGKCEEYEINKDERLRRVWFHIVSVVDDCLFAFAKLAGDNFLMYWVDGIYLQKYKSMNIDLQIIESKYGVEFSKVDIDKIEIVKESEHSSRLIVHKLPDGTKEFSTGNLFVNPTTLN